MIDENVNQQSFNEAYEILERNAIMLRDNTAPDIDKLVSVVTESVAAYSVVSMRLDAIDQSLKQVFGNLDSEAA